MLFKQSLFPILEYSSQISLSIKTTKATRFLFSPLSPCLLPSPPPDYFVDKNQNTFLAQVQDDKTRTVVWEPSNNWGRPEVKKIQLQVISTSNNLIINLFMNFIARITRLSLATPLRSSFSTTGIWKEREESAQKVYITLEQKKTLERLLGKIEESEHSPGLRELQFKRSLKEILNKYDVHCEAFEAEVMNLHRSC